MKVLFVVAGIAAAAGIAIAVVFMPSGPDFDAIITNKDCDAVMALTDRQMEEATINQQAGLALLITACLFAPDN